MAGIRQGGGCEKKDRPEGSAEKPSEGVGAHMTVRPDQLHLTFSHLGTVTALTLPDWVYLTYPHSKHRQCDTSTSNNTKLVSAPVFSHGEIPFIINPNVYFVYKKIMAKSRDILLLELFITYRTIDT